MKDLAELLCMPARHGGEGKMGERRRRRREKEAEASMKRISSFPSVFHARKNDERALLIERRIGWKNQCVDSVESERRRRRRRRRRRKKVASEKKKPTSNG